MRWVLWGRSAARRAPLSSKADGWVLAAVLAVGCFLPQGSPEGPDSGVPPTSGSQTASDVRLGSVSDGNQARLSNVVVVGPVEEDGQRFFVQDLGGGRYTGLQVRMSPGLALPDVEEGDVLALTGNAVATGERFDLWLRSETAVQITGTGSPTTVALDGPPRDWAPWVGHPITVGEVAVTGCPVEGEVATDLVPISQAWHDTGLARGDHLHAVTGVVVPTGFDVALWPRRAGDVDRSGDGSGCSLTAAEAQEDSVVGAVELPLVVRTTPAADSGATWVQDPSGAGGVLVADDPADPLVRPVLDGIAIGQAAALIGELRVSGGRLVLTPEAAVPGAVVGAVDVSRDALDATAVGQLVRVAELTVGDPVDYGAWSTDGGFVLDATFLRPLPVATGDRLDAVVGVVDRWPDGTLALLPRDAADLAPGP